MRVLIVFRSLSFVAGGCVNLRDAGDLLNCEIRNEAAGDAPLDASLSAAELMSMGERDVVTSLPCISSQTV
ncbi:MAG: hypothetical protein GY811_10755 [Myxococcales bacterium]|nr:hypothetical protein [Myxococcales bacterium]